MWRKLTSELDLLASAPSLSCVFSRALHLSSLQPTLGFCLLNCSSSEFVLLCSLIPSHHLCTKTRCSFLTRPPLHSPPAGPSSLFTPAVSAMDNNMEIDTARSPEPHHLSPTSDPGSIPTLDGWIESLMTCKQLAEEDVRRLCDRVGFLGQLYQQRIRIDDFLHCRQERYCRRSRMCSQWYVVVFAGRTCPTATDHPNRNAR